MRPADVIGAAAGAALIVHAVNGHAWAFLPDLAETMALLVERDDALEAFATFHFAGHWDPDGAAMTAAVGDAAGHPGMPARRFPWAMVRAASPFVPVFHEMLEMR